MAKAVIRDVMIFVVGSAMIIWLFMNLSADQRTIVNFFTLYGTFASLFGLWIAFEQIRLVKETAEATRIAVEQSTSRINQIVSISDLSKAIKIIHEIQQFLNSGKYELALLRMKDIKSILIQVKHSQNIVQSAIGENYGQLIMDLSIDITNLNDIIIGYKTGLNFSKVNLHLESIETFIDNLENELKHKNL